MQIPLFKVFMDDSASSEVSKVLESGYIGQGSKVDEFEILLKDYLGTELLNTVNSCTSAIHLALHSIKDDRTEVLTTPLTCTATNFPILANGLQLRWVDLDRNTCNLDLDDLRNKITANTLAVIVVHWGGYPIDLDKLKEIQEECFKKFGRKFHIIEDCAHALGSTYKNKMIGTHGNHCAFSFQAIKHLTTGDGGMLISTDIESFNQIKLLRWYGLDRTSSADFRCEQNIKDWGFKFHMNDIAAAIGICNMKTLDSRVNACTNNASFLRNNIKKGIMLESLDDRTSASWIFTFLVDKRDQFISKMKEVGIAVSRVHDRNDKHECLSKFRCNLPNTDWISERMICIPCGWWLSDYDLNYIVHHVNGGW